MAEGIVKFSPALFAKLASPPSAAVAQGIAQAGATLRASVERATAMRQQRELAQAEQAGAERRHLETLQAAAERQKESIDARAKEGMLERTHRGILHDEDLAEKRLQREQAMARFEKVELRLGKQFDKEFGLRQDAQTALESYRNRSVEMRERAMNFADRHRGVMEAIATSRFEFDKEQAGRKEIEEVAKLSRSMREKWFQFTVNAMEAFAVAKAKGGLNGDASYEKEIEEVLDAYGRTADRILSGADPDVREIQIENDKTLLRAIATQRRQAAVPLDPFTSIMMLRAGMGGGAGEGAEEPTPTSEALENLRRHPSLNIPR